MILELVLLAFENILLALFDTGALSGINIPALSDDVMSRLYSYLDLLKYARNFITFFIPPDAFDFGFKAFGTLFLTEKLYPLIMWIIRKIPLLNIS